ncbi:MAG: hypothetical protein GY868_07225 [Deltaproteobacteria bacterium]|nr:hypothetical protein [Deltaproteobacteria bacterium]
MPDISEVHSVFVRELKKSLNLETVALKHRLPVRPPRTLGLIRLDGEVFTAEKLLRVVCLRISLPCYMNVYSTFIRPAAEYSLPVFSCEVVRLGSKRIIVLDIHETGDDHAEREQTPFYDDLVNIRAGYSDVLACAVKSGGGAIQSVNSKAACRVKVPRALDERALDLVARYTAAYAGLVNDAVPLAGGQREAAARAFAEYLKTVVEHDPGVKANVVFFGKQEGLARAMDMFFGA